ncbi:MAG: crossover junction endodeoxyribonuclease RuvC [Alphaproteobacteria bacterium]
MRLLGLDPGLVKTGWGIIDSDGHRLGFVACGTVHGRRGGELAGRLAHLYAGLARVIEIWRPDGAAVEETFVNRNPASALKLGMARGVVLLAPAEAGLPVAEYHNKTVKKALVGAGRASKDQIGVMVRHLLPESRPDSEDAADALAVAICHAHHTATMQRVALAADGTA